MAHSQIESSNGAPRIATGPQPILPQLAGLFCQLGHHEAHPWRPLPWKGVFNKVLFFDRCTGATIEPAKVEKGAQFPEHYHTTVQTLFFVSARLPTGAGVVILPGTFNIIPAGQPHGPFVGEEESSPTRHDSLIFNRKALATANASRSRFCPPRRTAPPGQSFRMLSFQRQKKTRKTRNRCHLLEVT